MAKFNMKDYENFIVEEAIQDQLQEALEYKRLDVAYGTDEYWRDWQRKQIEEKMYV